MNYNFIVEKNEKLINILREKISNKSKNNIKHFLQNEMIKVNNKIVTNPFYEVNKKDVINIRNNFIRNKNIKIKIIYEDNNIIVVDKPSSMLTIKALDEKEENLYHIIRNYIIKENKNNKVFIIHRLDKGTSGVIMFAKNQKTKNLYQNNWDELVKAKEYLAITKSGIKKEGTISSYLMENKNHIVYSTNNKNGKYSLTKFKVISENKKYSLLKINIKTGRKNQIRVHLSDINYPIVGDKKYGSNLNPIKRLCLHSYKLEIINPYNKKLQTFISEIPESFEKLVLVK